MHTVKAALEEATALSGGAIFHWDGTSWQQTSAAGGPFGQVWGLDRNTLWAFSVSGYILHLQR